MLGVAQHLESLLRLSVGIEAPTDLAADLQNALDAANPAYVCPGCPPQVGRMACELLTVRLRNTTDLELRRVGFELKTQTDGLIPWFTVFVQVGVTRQGQSQVLGQLLAARRRADFLWLPLRFHLECVPQLDHCVPLEWSQFLGPQPLVCRERPLHRRQGEVAEQTASDLQPGSDYSTRAREFIDGAPRHRVYARGQNIVTIANPLSIDRNQFKSRLDV